jgi:hypothetical protein
MAAQTGFPECRIERRFWPDTETREKVSPGLYARVSTQDQHTLSMRSYALRQSASRRGWTVSMASPRGRLRAQIGRSSARRIRAVFDSGPLICSGLSTRLEHVGTETV